MATVYIIIYTLYHHIYKVALDVQKGLEAQGVTVKLFQVPETLDENVLAKLHAPERPNLPIITVNELTNADAFLFGVPTRFGTMPAQIKSFLDSTGSLWATGALSGKFVGTFFSTASQHGGQETTAYTLLTYFAHHGLNYVPLGFANAHLFDNSEVVGGSAYGAGTIANGDGSREPSKKELEIAYTQGENFAKILNTFQRGLSLLPATESVKEVATEENKPEENKAVPAAVEAAVAAPAATEGATRAIDEVAPASKATEPVVASKSTDPVAEPKATEPVVASKSTDPVVEPKATEPAVESKPSETKKSVSEKTKEKKESKCFCM